MNKFKTSAFAAGLSAAILLAAMVQAVHAQSAPQAVSVAPVAVTGEQLATLSAACAGGAGSSACVVALQALVTALQVANPGATIATVIGAISAQVAEMSNTALANPALALGFDAAAAAQSLTALATFAESSGLGDLGKTVGAMALNVQNKVSIDLAAIASGSGVVTPTKQASPA